MKKIIKEVIKLTPKSPAKEWAELEEIVMSNSKIMEKSDFFEVCLHYGDNLKGSSEFWNSMSQVAMRHYKSFSSAEVTNVFRAFSYAGTQYKFPLDFKKKMVRGLNIAVKEFGKCVDESDPTIRPALTKSLKEFVAEYDKMEDPFLQFSDDLKAENKEETEETIRIREFFEAWQKDYLKFMK